MDGWPRIYHRRQAQRESSLSLLRYHSGVPRPRNEREMWEEELAELPVTIAQHRAALAALPPGDRKWREFHDRLARRAERRNG